MFVVIECQRLGWTCTTGADSSVIVLPVVDVDSLEASVCGDMATSEFICWSHTVLSTNRFADITYHLLFISTAQKMISVLSNHIGFLQTNPVSVEISSQAGAGAGGVGTVGGAAGI